MIAWIISLERSVSRLTTPRTQIGNLFSLLPFKLRLNILGKFQS